MSPYRPKILLADDSVTIRKVVELTFADEGIDVHSVADSEAAMAAFVADQPDLVIADVNMPGVGGYKICEIIKEDDSTRHIPVILLTGSFEPFDPGEASRVGANFYFTKPFQSIRELVEKVTDLLDTNAFDLEHGPETEDIESLYKSSFADTLEMQANEASADLELIRIEDDEESAEPEPISDVVDERVEIFPDHLTVADLGYEGMDDEIPAHINERTESGDPVDAAPLETPTAADPFAAPVDLGDAGMDDEMIETSRPDDPRDDLHYRDTIEFEPVLVASASELSSDPFTSPVTTDDTMAKYNWSDDRDGEIEPIAETRPNTNLLRLEFAESDQAEISDRNEIESAAVETEEHEPAAPVERKTEAISPELIEMIAQRVIDRLSDKVIREVALEAVPRITESLIREALDHETKK